MSSKQLKILDKFAKELEEFARAAEGPGRAPELVKTPTPSEAHASVRTVQELLPYRQQFQDAGLAVTSAEQKAPLKSEKQVGGLVGSTTDGRLQLDGGGVSGHHSSTDTKESDSDTVVGSAEPNPMPLPGLPSNMERHPTEITLATSPPLESPPSVSSGEVGNAVAVEKRTSSRARPSAVFLMNKPLPARPGSFGPKPPERTSRGPLGSTTVAARKALFTPRVDRDLPEIPVEKSSVPVFPRSQMSVQVARDVIETRKSDKALPDLPISRIPPQGRHGLSFLGQPVWAPGTRQLPTTIIEEKEPSPEKNNVPVQRQIPLRPKDNNVMLQAANPESSRVNRDTKRKPANPELGGKPEPLPETWKHVIGTPSSFKKALDDVVRKLEDMEDKDKKPVANLEKVPSRRGSSKVPSPSQRLQRAAAMRRERLGGPSGQHMESVSERLKNSVPARNPRSNEGPRSNSRKPSVKIRGGGGEEDTLAGGSSSVQVPTPTHDDRDISDKDVLQGLKIICAASADHDFDAWIQSKTGLRLRRFLADLKTFENLTEDGILAMGDQRAARRRRSERRRRQAEGNGNGGGSVKGSSSRSGSVRRQPVFDLARGV